MDGKPTFQVVILNVNVSVSIFWEFEPFIMNIILYHLVVRFRVTYVVFY